MACREHLTQLRQREEEFEQLGVRFRIVTFDADFMARAYLEQTKLKWPLLIDKEKSLFEAYGMLRGNWWTITSPVAIWKYLRLMFKGQRVQKAGSDWLQMGGDVVIDPNGTICFHHISKTPHDRPDINVLLQVFQQIAAKSD